VITRCGESIRAMHPLFQVGQGGSIPTSPLHLRFFEVDKEWASRLNREWHSRFPELGGGAARVCYGAQHEGRMYAVAVWTNPSSPKLPQFSWLMLKRYAIADDAPRYTASRMLGWMTRDVRPRFTEVTTLVSYYDPDVHDGSIYAACGWSNPVITRRTKSTRWKNRTRRHTGNADAQRVARVTKVIRGAQKEVAHAS